MCSGFEKARTAFQLLGAPLASVLLWRYRAGLGPESGKLTVVVCARLGDQGADRERLALVQQTQSPFAKPTYPTVQSRVMRMPRTQPADTPAQRDVRKLGIAISRTGGLYDFPRKVLERRDLYRQYTRASPTDLAATQRYRRRTVLHAPAHRPAGTAIYPAGSVEQSTDDFAARTKKLRADVLTLDGHVEKGIISNGNGDWYSAFRFSRRCGCCRARTSLLTTNRKPYDPTPINANTVRADGEL